MRCSSVALLAWLLQQTFAGPSSGAVESGDVALRSGQFDAAIAQYSLACDLEPSSYLGFMKRSSVYTVLGQKRSALKDLDTVLRINPANLNALLKRAKLRVECCELKGVDQDLELALKLGGQLPLSLSELFQLTSMYRQAQNLGLQQQDPVGAARSALGIFNRMFERSQCTDSEAVLTLVVQLLLRVAEYEQAVVDGGKLIKLNRHNVDALGLRAHAFYLLGDLEMSINHLRQGLKHDPEHKTCKALHKKVREPHVPINCGRRGIFNVASPMPTKMSSTPSSMRLPQDSAQLSSLTRAIDCLRTTST